MTIGKIEKLACMANQIAPAMPDREATAGVASHLSPYWTPKMIREIIAFADQGHPGLNAIAARAVESLKQKATAA